MHPLREWLFRTVANELSFRGINGIHLKQLASMGGVNAEQVHTYFPDKRALIFGLIDEICAAQKDFILQHLRQADTPDERSIQFIINSRYKISYNGIERNNEIIFHMYNFLAKQNHQIEKTMK